jgi:hypothetical protein
MAELTDIDDSDGTPMVFSQPSEDIGPIICQQDQQQQ